MIAIKKHASTAVFCVLLVLAIAGIANAARVMTQSEISVIATEKGIIENGMRFFTYDGGPFSMVEKDGIVSPFLDARSGSSSRYLYFWVDDKVAFDGPFKAEITFTYMAPQAGQFRLLYDNLVTGNRYTPTEYIQVKAGDVGKWLKHTFKLENVMFSNEAAQGTADMRLHTNIPFYVRACEIKLTAQ